MTAEIAAVLAILAVSLVLFVTEKLRMDVVALLVLGTLAASGLVGLDEALAGFSNPAVVTVWAMFILSAGLSATGIANAIGQRVLALAGDSPARMLMTIMLTTGVLSAFMNNIGVAALMLPVVMDIARRTNTPPSRLLMPMAYASLLGGLTTLIGTPPNLVASTVLRQSGLEGFSLFEFTPIGLPALVVGAILMAFLGPRILPVRMPKGRESEAGKSALRFSYDLAARRFRLRVPTDSPLAGRTLAQCGLTATLGLNVLTIRRGPHTISRIDGQTMLAGGDILTAQGRIEDFRDFLDWRPMAMASGSEIFDILSKDKVAVARAAVANDSELIGLTVQETGFRSAFGVNIRGIHRGGRLIRDRLASQQLEADDVLIVDGRRKAVERLPGRKEFGEVQILDDPALLAAVYPPSFSLIELRIPDESTLAGVSVADSGLYDSLRLEVLGIARKDGSIYFPGADEVFRPGDQLLVVGPPESLEVMKALRGLELIDDEAAPPQEDLPGNDILVELTLSPESAIAGRSLRELDFRKRYGFLVLSIWRRGRPWRSHLRTMHLELGDALLLSGPRDDLERLEHDPDFIVLTRPGPREKPVTAPHRAALAGGFMLAVVVSVLAGWLPIAIAAVCGAALMVATRCLSMEDAYRAIDWKSVFLIAGMIPLGTAMDKHGAARWIAEGVSTVAEPLGMWGILAAIYLLTALATTIVPTTALVLIMAPIAIEASLELGHDPKLLMMAVAMAASASFTSPISHPANVLVMGPGGYRFLDYVKLGAALAVVVMLTVLPLIVWRYA